eukprot:CAMPEP_0172508432 /NCGR_PEP_ID=MMETSP1066-20121228/211857_1 /TAXON_ID=671091 /ORGANISM="Coscinodiscus wailesii, Strain CCMP2513" /LENGTH=283 /DNA_ID=CAMNT_0013286405 /DNA_START=95 /DNA_END=946 /DNA_ORIENTATION=-
MVLYLIGLGLGDEKDITIRGLETIKSCTHIFLEAYTSILRIDKSKLESYYQKPITIADRNFVECDADKIYAKAKEVDVALLVVGDPVCATTHGDIIVRARDEGVKVEIIHNASIMGAAGCCGLQLYNFGHTVSIPFFEENWRPTSFYPKIKYNRGGGMHTLCLLDIKVKEPDFEAMTRGRTVYLPPRYMSVNTALEQLLEVEAKLGEGVYDGAKTLCVGMARLGQVDRCIVAGTMKELLGVDFGEPLHSLVICGEVHEMEMEFLKDFLVEGSTFLSCEETSSK